MVCHMNAAQVRAFVYVGPCAVRTLFDFFATLTPEQVEGCRERVEAWSGDRTQCAMIDGSLTINLERETDLPKSEEKDMH